MTEQEKPSKIADYQLQIDNIRAKISLSDSGKKTLDAAYVKKLKDQIKQLQSLIKEAERKQALLVPREAGATAPAENTKRRRWPFGGTRS
jgi:ppGpp synthetase/RelA/SpoT-type nucleotidyltranferase